MPQQTLLSAVRVLPIQFTEELHYFILDTTEGSRTQDHCMNLWRYVLSKYVCFRHDPEQGNHDGSVPWVVAEDALAFVLSVAASGSSEDLLAAEEAAFDAAYTAMTDAGIRWAWVLTAYGSRAKPWSYNNKCLSSERTTVRAVFPRSNQRGDADSYSDLPGCATEWSHVLSLMTIRPRPRSGLMGRLFDGTQADFVVDRTLDVEVTNLRPLEGITFVGELPTGESKALPEPDAWVRAYVCDHLGTRHCWMCTEPARFIASNPGPRTTRWRSSLTPNRYWSLSLPSTD